ncbi:Shr3 amino acid permease chaperone [Pseudovirgaria hyperparasitica]|uniref:Shr3 amino acid permease chaperone n=1 Tax=Pseudovirgaria hyperparasitica TaxID=470096 RepID=A0A6A6VRL2_9PEZI|nr:Shr3 amino acid permease chaperone [Pseudovirgaria hyperparasitica]KAF2752795.1 Shr3 amino acid permease chaperone [Pseudovirgaria hyperparasitica]
MTKTNSFATFLIIGPTCFFLGILFAAFPYDYNVLWANPTEPEPYFAKLEEHLKFLYASPPLISRILHIVIATGLLGFLTKLYKPTEANVLFDGASLVLYMCGIAVYIANIIKGLRVVTAGIYGNEDGTVEENVDYVGREDSLRVISASNTIVALVLVGVLVLQAGQWYAQKKEEAEIAEMDRISAEKRDSKSAGGKKKQ